MTSSVSNEQRITIVQGEYRVSSNPDVVLSTLLGSCVAACICDSRSGVGGMNHFLLPGDLSGVPNDSERFGVHLMELLINGLMSHGARRDRLEAKIFGGAAMVQRLGDIGARNGEFAKRFLEYEGIQIVAADLGGNRGRRLLYSPTTGRAKLSYIEDAAVPRERPAPARNASSAGVYESFS